MPDTPPHPDNATLQQIGNLREHLEKLIQSNDRRYEQRDQFQQEALRIALDANNRRLDTMNEFRASLSDQANRMITRSESEMAIQAVIDKNEEACSAINIRLDAELRPVHAKVSEMGKPNWALMGSAISILFVLVAGMYTIIGLKIDASLTPLITQESQNKTAIAVAAETLQTDTIAISASSQADVNSRADRSQMNSRIQTLENQFSISTADMRAFDATVASQMVEIETQFKSLSHAHNEMNDQQQRINGLLWNKVYNEKLPPTDFRPNFFRER
jgi:hypothetical protein